MNGRLRSCCLDKVTSRHSQRASETIETELSEMHALQLGHNPPRLYNLHCCRVCHHYSFRFHPSVPDEYPVDSVVVDEARDGFDGVDLTADVSVIWSALHVGDESGDVKHGVHENGVNDKASAVTILRQRDEGVAVHSVRVDNESLDGVVLFGVRHDAGEYNLVSRPGVENLDLLAPSGYDGRDLPQK